MKIITTLLVIYIITSNISAQETTTTSEFKNQEFGAHAGFTTGLGFSYRHWFNNFGLQGTFIPIKTDYSFVTSVGATALYTLKRVNKIHAYLYLGNHLLIGSYENEEYNPDTGMYESVGRSYENMYNIGFGPGFSFGKTVSISVMVGYGVYDVANSFNLLPTGELGIYYMF